MKKISVLEGVRGSAAIYVLLTHFVPSRMKVPHLLDVFFRFGQEAVMLFFLLSGFVIYFSFSRQPQQSFREYFRRRALRIFPIYLLSLLIAYLVICLNVKHFAPFDGLTFLGNMCMLQDFKGLKPGVWFEPFCSNSPVWSLSYEWWFYMMFFPLVKFVPESKQLWVAGGVAFLGFVSYVLVPNQIGLYLIYFLIWWMGVEIARVYINGIKPKISDLKAPISLLSALTLLQLLNVVFWTKILHRPISFGIHPILEFRHFAFSLLVVLLALSLSSASWRFFTRLLTPSSVVAPISYAIYVMHVPLAVHGEYLSFIRPVPIQLLLYVCIAVTVAYLAEIPMQRNINNLWKPGTSKTSKS